MVPPPASIDETAASRALDAFILSCPALMRRTDRTQLTAGSDWVTACAAAPNWRGSRTASSFFQSNFDWVRVGDGKAFATGYYIPETAGSRTPAPGYTVPVYRTPPDLVRCTKPDGTTGRGRIDETGTCVLYFTRP